MKKYIIIISLVVIILAVIIYQNRPMAISRQSSAYFLQNVVSANSYTHSAYNPGYGGTEKGRIIMMPFRSSSVSGSLPVITSITYGGIQMNVFRAIIGAGQVSQGIAYISNPPSGAQDIVFTIANTVSWTLRYAPVAYESDTDSTFRAADMIFSSTLSTNNKTTTLTTTPSVVWSISLSCSATQNQTITTGTLLVSDADPGRFMVTDSNAELSSGSTTGIGVTTPANGEISQHVLTFTILRRGFFYFLVDNI